MTKIDNQEVIRSERKRREQLDYNSNFFRRGKQQFRWAKRWIDNYDTWFEDWDNELQRQEVPTSTTSHSLRFFMYVKINEALYVSSDLKKRVVVYKDLGVQVFSENGQERIEPIGALNDVVSVDSYVLWLAGLAAQDEDAYSLANNGRKVYRFGGWAVGFSDMGKSFSTMNVNLGRHSVKLLVKNERRKTFEVSADD